MKKEYNKLLKYLIITSTLSSVLIGSSGAAEAAVGAKKFDRLKRVARPSTKDHKVNLKTLEAGYTKSLKDRMTAPDAPPSAGTPPPPPPPPSPPSPKASKPLSLNPTVNMAEILGGERKKIAAKQTDKAREIEREFQKRQKDLQDKIVAQGRDLFDQLKARAQSLTVSTQEVSNDSLVSLKAITANRISKAEKQVTLNEQKLIDFKAIVSASVDALKKEVNSRLETVKSELAASGTVAMTKAQKLKLERKISEFEKDLELIDKAHLGKDQDLLEKAQKADALRARGNFSHEMSRDAQELEKNLAQIKYEVSHELSSAKQSYAKFIENSIRIDGNPPIFSQSYK